MPELPDIVVYIEALEQRILDQPLDRIRIASPFLLRTAEPPIQAAKANESANSGGSANALQSVLRMISGWSCT